MNNRNLILTPPEPSLPLGVDAIMKERISDLFHFIFSIFLRVHFFEFKFYVYSPNKNRIMKKKSSSVRVFYQVD